jgi:hypothetical protein
MGKHESGQQRRRGARPVGARAQPATAAAPRDAPPASWPPVRRLPSVVGLGLALFAWLGGGPDDARFRAALYGVGLLLVGWNAVLLRAPRSRARGLTVSVEIYRHHYMQVFSQLAIMLFWGLQLPFSLVTDHLPLMAVQIAFAYGFDMLLAWSHRGRYTLGFGPFPIIFSINLFLWFRPEWFFLQFVIIAAGFAAKELLRWDREGRRVHIFNPSSFPLALASLVLIATSSTHLTHGELIASSQNGVPHMYLLLFLVALPGQVLFGVASMTVSAVLTTYLFGRLYLAATGTYFFFDCYVPVPVFLGMHLLFTDPSTAPRTELGRVIYGVMYGLSTVALYQVFLILSVPNFYDKLLQVPLLNLSVRWLDRLGRSPRLAWINPERLGRSLAPRWRYAGYASIWAVSFALLSSAHAVGDRHPGQWWPYWIRTCEQGSPRACAYLATVQHDLCRKGSGWACNEAAILGPRSYPGLDTAMDRAQTIATFDRGCALGFDVACHNRGRVADESLAFERAPPTLADYPILLRGSRRWSIPDSTADQLYARACAQGWPGTCESTTLRAGP